MAHLNFFGIDNFRVFQGLNRFDFRPITVLVGTNSSGKSSLSKGILCLKSAFEKVKFQSSSQENFSSHIDMWAIEQLFFKPYLNLGNFSTCVNTKSASSDVSFELPLRFPLLEDDFVIRFVYEIEDNALKNGKLKEIEIIHSNTQTPILQHSNITGKLRIKFTLLKEKLESEIEKIIKIHEIEKEINNIEEPFWKGNSLIHQDLPTNVQQSISELRKKQKNISKTYSIHNALYTPDEDSFESETIMYDTSIYQPHERYTLGSPFFNYSFLFKKEFLEKHQSELKIHDINALIIANGELLQSLNMKISTNDQIEKKSNTFINYIKDLEIKVLENIVYHSNFSSDFAESKFLSAALYQITQEYFIYPKLKESNLLFDEIFQKNLILNPIKDLLPNNFKFFVREFIYDGIGRALEKIGSIYRSMHYIPSIRTKMDRVFRVGTNDSYLQEVLFGIFKSNLETDAKKFIDKYLQKFDIADCIDLELSSDSVSAKIFFIKKGERKELADLGYGISQVLPIILKLGTIISNNSPNELYSQFHYSSSIVIVEEPETNLHPALQSKLADMFVECYQKYNIQFIVETHSEYLIRKLQYLTAKKEFVAKDANIYYFHDPNNVPTGEPQVKKIEILEDGSLSSDFGTGFFDEATNWKFELLRMKNAQKN